MPPYIYYPTRHFLIRLEKIRHRDPVGHDRIQGVIDRLLANPADADGRMKGIHHGRFKKYVGRGDYRLIYYYCAICRKTNLRLVERCGHCESVQDNSVVFFEVYHKNEMKKLVPADF